MVPLSTNVSFHRPADMLLSGPTVLLLLTALIVPSDDDVVTTEPFTEDPSKRPFFRLCRAFLPVCPAAAECRDEKFACTRLYSVHRPVKQCIHQQLCFTSLRRMYIINNEICSRLVCREHEAMKDEICRQMAGLPPRRLRRSSNFRLPPCEDVDLQRPPAGLGAFARKVASKASPGVMSLCDGVASTGDCNHAWPCAQTMRPVSPAHSARTTGTARASWAIPWCLPAAWLCPSPRRPPRCWLCGLPARLVSAPGPALPRLPGGAAGPGPALARCATCGEDPGACPVRLSRPLRRERQHARGRGGAAVAPAVCTPLPFRTQGRFGGLGGEAPAQRAHARS
ncbi:Microfibrillar-associated protein 5 [Galemys pyrenaicus]|uniref:Microfibrillar-associated protein 5 n=1 Tax=Galemys pyrenaicus TaxID=202257 RepID=A0A8J6AH45_GALPY|nr:Microfibrillar-associated protein 5 [Galemys pyrenaicus]